MVKKLLLLFLIYFSSLFFSPKILAADIKTDYQVQYILNESPQSVVTKVFFNIKLTNLNPEIYVKKFSLNFPSSFTISNLKATDDDGDIHPTIEKNGDKTKIDLEFTNPKPGRDVSNSFYLEFNQEKLFNRNGNVWEVILPTISDDKSSSTYKVIVNLPSSSDKKLSIAKPKPDVITGKQIVWTNPTSKTIYAVFGDTQYYETDLTYTIKNPKLVPVYTELAFPPQTLYQKVFVSSIDPAPASVYEDADGNYLGKYYLNPSEQKTIRFKGILEVKTTPFEDVKPVIANKIETQKKYLLTDNKYWSIPGSLINEPELVALKTPKEIYDYTVHKLSYNYSNVKVNNSRLGAASVLVRPDQAVCVEFSDLFIALAREKGVYARELEGYGFSQDQQLRPLSLISDILHSWPEYLNTQSGLWTPVDPTWENTSGIDYFSSLDLNHIVLAIHGQQPDYPVPAGMYKAGSNSQDISIKATSEVPKHNSSISSRLTDLPKKMHDKTVYKINLQVTNKGNEFEYSLPVDISSDGLQITPRQAVIESLAPYQTYELPLEISVPETKIKKSTIRVSLKGKQILAQPVEIEPYYIQLTVNLIGAVALGVVLLAVLKLTRKKHAASRTSDHYSG